MTTIEGHATPTMPPAPPAAPDREFKPFGNDGFTFDDVLDVINPLQHIPVVSTVYRRLSGDTLDPGSRFLGGTLFGGPLGAFAAVVNGIVEAQSGKDVGEHIAVAVFGEPDRSSVAVAGAFVVPEGDAVPAAPDWVAGALSPHLVERRPLPNLSETSRPAAWTPFVDVAALAQPEPATVVSEARTSRAVPAGAAAQSGGWFAETMLSALRKYEEAVARERARNPSVAQAI